MVAFGGDRVDSRAPQEDILLGRVVASEIDRPILTLYRYDGVPHAVCAHCGYRPCCS